MPPTEVFSNPRRSANAELRRKSTRENPLIPNRRTLAFTGIALGVLVLAVQCCQYLVLGAYFDHIEGNVVVSGWQYVHSTPLYRGGRAAIFDLLPRSPTLPRYRHCCCSARMW